LFEPAGEVLALADVEEIEDSATFDDGFNTDASDAHTAADGELAEPKEVEADRAEGGVGDGGATEGEFKGGEVGATEGEDFGCGVRESTAEGLTEY
jgi:hypothetical protein